MKNIAIAAVALFLACGPSQQEKDLQKLIETGKKLEQERIKLQKKTEENELKLEALKLEALKVDTANK